MQRRIGAILTWHFTYKEQPRNLLGSNWMFFQTLPSKIDRVNALSSHSLAAGIWDEFSKQVNFVCPIITKKNCLEMLKGILLKLRNGKFTWMFTIITELGRGALQNFRPKR